jgi:hypothetical protein
MNTNYIRKLKKAELIEYIEQILLVERSERDLENAINDALIAKLNMRIKDLSEYICRLDSSAQTELRRIEDLQRHILELEIMNRIA